MKALTFPTETEASMPSWGECYLDHYEKHFRQMRSRSVFESKPGTPSLQILEYRNVFPGGARVYCTLGLSHFAAELKSVSEVMLAVDGAFEAAQVALANACFFAVDQRSRSCGGWS